jgi:tetratricopeptide (TPR) repeat protein
LQGEIAKEMTAALRMRLTGEDEKRMAKSHTANPDAYQNYLKGRYWWNKRNEEGTNKGIEYFQQAISRDPGYALAYSGLADCYSSFAYLGFVSPKEAYPKAKVAALKALEIDDTLAEAHVSMAVINVFYDWDWSGGLREIQRVLALSPDHAYAHLSYGTFLANMGRLEEAIVEDKRALELDPLSLVINRATGIVFYMSRQYDQAIEQFRKTLELENSANTHRWLGLAYLQKSMHQEGIAEFQEMLAISPGSAVALSEVGYGYALAGRRAEAQMVLEQLDELSKYKYVPTVSIARIYTGLGDKDTAFKWLEKSYDDRSIGGLTSVKVNPTFDPLRSDPRFADLLRRMNLQP